MKTAGGPALSSAVVLGQGFGGVLQEALGGEASAAQLRARRTMQLYYTNPGLRQMWNALLDEDQSIEY